MDLTIWILMLRGPLEVLSLWLAFAPAFMVLQAWAYLPKQIPVRFGVTGRPSRWGGRGQAWILPLIALVVYSVLSQATGTWAWFFDSSAQVPEGCEILLVLKPAIAFLMAQATSMLIRVAREQTESLNGWLVCGLMALLLAPPLALTVAVH